MSQGRVKKRNRPVNIDASIAAMLNVIAIYEKKSVAEVCDPMLKGQVLKRFEQLPEAVQGMADLPASDASFRGASA